MDGDERHLINLRTNKHARADAMSTDIVHLTLELGIRDQAYFTQTIYTQRKKRRAEHDNSPATGKRGKAVRRCFDRNACV